MDKQAENVTKEKGFASIKRKNQEGRLVEGQIYRLDTRPWPGPPPPTDRFAPPVNRLHETLTGSGVGR